MTKLLQSAFEAFVGTFDIYYQTCDRQRSQDVGGEGRRGMMARKTEVEGVRRLRDRMTGVQRTGRKRERAS